MIKINIWTYNYIPKYKYEFVHIFFMNSSYMFSKVLFISEVFLAYITVVESSFMNSSHMLSKVAPISVVLPPNITLVKPSFMSLSPFSSWIVLICSLRFSLFQKSFLHTSQWSDPPSWTAPICSPRSPYFCCSSSKHHTGRTLFHEFVPIFFMLNSIPEISNLVNRLVKHV